MQITNEMINRINELAHKKKSDGLTPEEQAEQKALYKDYLAAIRGQVKESLSNVRFVEDLTEEELKEELKLKAERDKAAKEARETEKQEH